MAITIQRLTIYPVKSLGGIDLKTAELTASGLAGDREWMIVDKQGQFATQRKHPLMATIKTSLTNGKLVLTNLVGETITVEKPSVESLLDVSIWKDHLQAITAKPEYDKWLTESVKSPTPLRLVYFDKNQTREIENERFGKGYTLFADGAPFLITNTDSLNALNRELIRQRHASVDMNRFRANIVISGLSEFAEHKIKKIQSLSTNSVIELKDHCQRCSIITVNQTTGIASKPAHIFKHLARINSMPNNPKAPAFGVNSILLNGEGLTIEVGETFATNK